MSERQRAKQILLEKLRKMKIKSETTNKAPISIKNQPPLYPVPLQRPSTVLNPKDLLNQRQKLDEVNLQQKYDTFQKPLKNKEEEQENEKQHQRKILKTRKPYYEHYVKDGTYVPALEYIQNHPNPSGKPPNIPESYYQGIQVIPKRPWVFFGPENIPPSNCQEINEKNFSLIFDKAKLQKKKNSGILKKPSIKRKGQQQFDDGISQISDQFTSNFTFTDSLDLSKESDLISEFRSQTRNVNHSRNTFLSSQNLGENSINDQRSSVSGSVQQSKKYNLFNSSESESESESISLEKKNNKKKVMYDSSDEEVEQRSVLPSEVQSSLGISSYADDDLSSSLKVDLYDESCSSSRKNRQSSIQLSSVLNHRKNPIKRRPKRQQKKVPEKSIEKPRKKPSQKTKGKPTNKRRRDLISSSSQSSSSDAEQSI